MIYLGALLTLAAGAFIARKGPDGMFGDIAAAGALIVGLGLAAMAVMSLGR